jgi:hypothetical protein
MVANDAVPLLPLTNSKTQVTTQSDGEGGGTGSRQVKNTNCHLVSLVWEMSLTHACITFLASKPMIIIAGWD